MEYISYTSKKTFPKMLCACYSTSQQPFQNHHLYIFLQKAFIKSVHPQSSFSSTPQMPLGSPVSSSFDDLFPMLVDPVQLYFCWGRMCMYLEESNNASAYWYKPRILLSVCIYAWDVRVGNKHQENVGQRLTEEI